MCIFIWFKKENKQRGKRSHVPTTHFLWPFFFFFISSLSAQRQHIYPVFVLFFSPAPHRLFLLFGPVLGFIIITPMNVFINNLNNMLLILPAFEL